MKHLGVFSLLLLFLFSCDKTIPVSSVGFNYSEITLTEGESFILQVSILPSDATNKEVIWSSSNETVAGVTPTGTIFALKEGRAIISATCGDKNAVCLVVVNKAITPITSISITPPSLKLRQYETRQLSLTIKPDEAVAEYQVVWKSSDQSVVSVNNGLVTANLEGTALISAEAGGKSAVCSVSVSNTMSGGNENTNDDNWD